MEGLLSSLEGGGKLAECDLGIIDLGLTDSGKDRIRALKADAHIVKGEWRRDFSGRDRAPEYKKIHTSKPFLPDMFPGYDGYVWMDADMWFQDASAIDDYIDAGRETGAAFSFESHPSYRSNQKIKKIEIFGKVFIKGVSNYFLSRSRDMFGARSAVNNGVHPVLNSGLFYIAAGSPIWQAWQQALLTANLKGQHRAAQISDQTCLQMALIQGGLAHATMPATHNWIPYFSRPLVDAETSMLLDPVYPNSPIKVVHLVH